MSSKITVAGGDSRFLSVKDYFGRKGFSVNTVFLGEKNNSIYNTVVLPVPVFRNGFLNAPLTKEKVSDDYLLSILPDNSSVFGGMIPELFRRKCEKKNIRVTDYYKDEILLNENAVLTAKAIPFVLEENGVSVKNGHIFILGYGRCGSAIADVLSSVGGNVTVVTGKHRVDNYRFIHFEDFCNYSGEAEIIINTVPSTVLSENELVKLNRNAVLIEIASAPYGIDFSAAQRFEINVIKAPSLPGRYFPVQAGEVIAKTVFKEMN